ncbi:hypothetical protein BAE30_16550 [Acidithiobacillus caldus]|uniref:Virulence-associated protein E n=1 Tax=Acidithiobacillus caldus TaxID=33059 RepID=A0A1E7YS17_9PROT|nr:hypothetical protein BAE30_16550 [Acidithiobacillus caldus]
MTRPIEKLLPLLDRARQTAPDKWIALCPAHDDKRPSLSIREADDGKILLKCWTGCSAAEIVNALGLSLADLFPGDRRHLADHGTGPMRRPFDYRDALTGVAHEATVARFIIAAARSGHPLTDEDVQRLALAEERIDAALRAAGGAR